MYKVNKQLHLQKHKSDKLSMSVKCNVPELFKKKPDNVMAKNENLKTIRKQMQFEMCIHSQPHLIGNVTFKSVTLP